MLNEVNSLTIIHQFCDNDEQILEISGSINQNEIKKIYDNLLAQDFEEINFYNPHYSIDIQGIIQLFLSFYIISTEKL